MTKAKSSRSAPPISRRQFIRVTAFGGLALGAGLAGRKLLLSQGMLRRTQATRLLMGCVANLTIIGEDPAHAETAIETAFERMQGLEAVLSRFSPESDLSRLNAAGSLDTAHPALISVLRRSIEVADLSAGAFEITIEPVLRLYREASRGGGLPSGRQITAALQLVDYHQIQMHAGGVILQRPGAAVTLDGIAKGFVIDQGAASLKEAGYPDVLIEVGGDLSACGSPQAGAWRIGIQSPQGATQPSAVVTRLADQALATSGDYLQAFTPDRRLHHILDPRSGRSPLELSSVSVVAADACTADALSTALMVLGPDIGLQLVERLPGVEALLITKGGKMLTSKRFPRM